MALVNQLQFQPPVIAHRGASAYAPENTLIAFTKAAQLGIKWIEFDVMQAACGEPIIFHDETLERTSNGKGEVGDYPYAQLCKLDAGAWFDPIYSNEVIPSFKHIINFLQETQLSANVEIKALPETEEQLIKRVLIELKNASLPHSTILFSSFSISALHHLRKYASRCLLGLLLHEWEEDWQAISESLQCVSVHVNHEIMTAARAKEIKAINKKLLCYTVNDRARAQELFSWGVDAVFSDVPDQICSPK